MRKFMQGLEISNEAIAFQNGIFCKELVIVYQEMITTLKKSDNGNIHKTEGFSGRFSQLIAKYTNLATEVSVNNNTLTNHYGPHVYIPEVNKNNPLLNDDSRAYISSGEGLKLIQEAAKSIKGSVDLKNSRVSGAFTKFPTTIHIPIKFITSGKFTAEEMAAITLHEIGHIFTFYEFISRTVRTNQVLAGIAVSYNGATPAEREVLLTSAKQILNLKHLDEKSLARSTTDKEVNVVLLSESINECRSELGVSLYDMKSYEYLSDEFATRHGAGVHLVTGLEKLYRGTHSVFFRGSVGYLFMEAIKITLLATLIFAPGIIQFSFPLYFMMVGMDTNEYGSYDNPPDRFRRIRNQLVEALKDKTVPEVQVKQITEDLNTIDNIVDSLNENRQLFDILREFVLPWSRKYRNQRLLQQELEKLATNDLFIKAAEFKHLNKVG